MHPVAHDSNLFSFNILIAFLNVLEFFLFYGQKGIPVIKFVAKMCCTKRVKYLKTCPTSGILSY